jgi:very-short-patch-repair endonuclease
VIEGFVLDFYCPEVRLGIEVDGGVHLKRKDYDELRQEAIESKGITIIRITNRELLNRKRSILGKLNDVIR